MKISYKLIAMLASCLGPSLGSAHEGIDDSRLVCAEPSGIWVTLDQISSDTPYDLLKEDSSILAPGCSFDNLSRFPGNNIETYWMYHNHPSIFEVSKVTVLDETELRKFFVVTRIRHLDDVRGEIPKFVMQNAVRPENARGFFTGWVLLAADHPNWEKAANDERHGLTGNMNSNSEDVEASVAMTTSVSPAAGNSIFGNLASLVTIDTQDTKIRITNENCTITVQYVMPGVDNTGAEPTYFYYAASAVVDLKNLDISKSQSGALNSHGANIYLVMKRGSEMQVFIDRGYKLLNVPSNGDNIPGIPALRDLGLIFEHLDEVSKGKMSRYWNSVRESYVPMIAKAYFPDRTEIEDAIWQMASACQAQ